MKFIFVFLFIVAIGVTILMIKSQNSDKIKNNGAQTTGKVIEVFNRGKLPYCKYTYTVEGIKYTKKQNLPKHLVKKVLNKNYTVLYELNNPKNSMLKYNK